MNRLFLYSFNAKLFQFLVENLAQVHHHRFVDLLPQMSTEDLDQGDLQCRNLAVQENTGQVELDLEANIDVGPVDSRRPKQAKMLAEWEH